jgi:hypothetical protein
MICFVCFCSGAYLIVLYSTLSVSFICCVLSLVPLVIFCFLVRRSIVNSASIAISSTSQGEVLGIVLMTQQGQATGPFQRLP